MENIEETAVVIVGAGPAGLAVSACLSLKSIPYILLEKEDCVTPLWKKHAYDRLHLHLAKNYCFLPFKPHSPSTPTYLSKDEFIQYIDGYVSDFNIKPRLSCCVECALYLEDERKWNIRVKNYASNGVEIYRAQFLVIASGENAKVFIPEIEGLSEFKGQIIHSSEYKSGLEFHGKNVLVIGCGNSGMEIAYDLANYGAHTSIVIRSPFHVVSRELIRLGMFLLKYLPITVVDSLVTFGAKTMFGDLSKYGIHRPKEGPFFLKATKGRSPVIDVGTVSKIKSREIKVLPAVSSIKEDIVVFENGQRQAFDAIMFATGFRSTACDWLEDYCYVLNDQGFPKNRYPLHWKGEKGVYCVGLSRMGLFGVSSDAEQTANDIAKLFQAETDNSKGKYN